MIFWYALGGILLLISVAILVPRVHVKGVYSKDQRELGLDWQWVKMHMDFREDSFSGSIFYRKFPQEKKAAEPEGKPPKHDYKPSTKVTSLLITEPEPLHEPAPVVKPEEESYQTDYPDLDTVHKPSEKKKFKIPKMKFGRRAKISEPEMDAESDDKDEWFWLKYIWRERGLAIDLLKGLFRSMVRFIHHIRTDYCHIDLALGTGDPMTTALAAGSLESTLWLMRRHGRVEIAPLYEEERFEFEVSCSFSMRPYQAVNIFVWYVLTLPWVRLVRVGWDVKGKLFGK